MCDGQSVVSNGTCVAFNYNDCFKLFITYVDVVHLLSTSQKHLERRALADKHYRKNAQRMKDRYNSKKVQIFKVGDAVSVRVPKIDRSATDLRRLPCIIVERRGTKQFRYQLQSKYGVL